MLALLNPFRPGSSLQWPTSETSGSNPLPSHVAHYLHDACTMCNPSSRTVCVRGYDMWFPRARGAESRQMCQSARYRALAVIAQSRSMSDKGILPGQQLQKACCCAICRLGQILLSLRDDLMRHSAGTETKAVSHPSRNLIDTGGILTRLSTLNPLSRASTSLDHPASLEAP